MKIFFSVGEPSGDLHGANLIRELRQRHPDIECVGFGGPRMQAAGAELLEDLTRLAVMWFLRALLNLHHFLRLFQVARRYFREHRPDAVVLIDYPGFNWWVARAAKRETIPVFYYGAPQMWAWAPWRVRKMRRLIDHVLCKLPFEETWFQQRGCRATYVGHPYFDEMVQQVLDAAFLQRYREPGTPLVTILPGSRTQEVGSNLTQFLAAAQQVRAQLPNVRFAVAAYNEAQADAALREIIRRRLPMEVHVGKTAELIHLADCCMACSGSVSLELLHHEKPTVILYRISPPAFAVQRVFRRVKYITLVNLLATRDPFPRDLTTYDPDHQDAERVPFPEYLTYRDVSARIAAHVTCWLQSPEQRRVRVEELRALKSRFAHPGATRRAAEYVLERLGDRAPVRSRPRAA
jgi:lipid-A-disaccharide synthase